MPSFYLVQNIQDLFFHVMVSMYMEFDTPSGPKLLKTKLLVAVFDFPSKAMALRSTVYTIFNGYHDYPHCKEYTDYIAFCIYQMKNMSFISTMSLTTGQCKLRD